MKKRGRDELEKEVKRPGREIQKQLRRSYWQYVGGLFGEDQGENSKPCLKGFWTYVKHQRSTSVGIPALKSQGRLMTDPRLKAEVLNNQFTNRPSVKAKNAPRMSSPASIKCQISEQTTCPRPR